ncbi:hypothetical protein BT67DRAFT_155978 [Trichocladium antarcticum]|uniref:Transcription factor Rba50 n=1 Tax=Trichocladium antarcticum TaxID=1450529 RepID=A0AAN6ZA34_9PEZI|nr:hypothetical protein BT67DRAFT_155978 [Trichocladium antarcticum]
MDTTLEIFDIKEREISDIKPPSFPTPSATGFPAPRKRVSAFKQQRQAKATVSAAPAAPVASSTPRPGVAADQNGAPSQQGPAMDERRGIDEENKAVLDSMSPGDRAAAQKELFDSFDPKFLQMLLRRANLDPIGPSPFDAPPTETPPSSDRPPPAKPLQATVEDDPEPSSGAGTSPAPKRRADKPKKTVAFDEDAAPPAAPPSLFPATTIPRPQPPPSDDLAHNHINTHFPQPPRIPDLDPADPDFLETMHRKYFPNLPADPSKLAWMAPIPTPDSAADRESPYYPGQDSLSVAALRFDFRGALLPPRVSRAIPANQGLHHHGEAPEAAGYTIPELARLARSAVPAQRCLAYQTLGRMLYRLGRGDWGVGAGGRDGDEDDLVFSMWRCFREGKVLESLEEEAGQPEGKGHLSCKAYATEALWLFEKGGFRESWKGR